MSLLSYTEICELIEQEVIQGAEYENVNSASLDIRLAGTIFAENISGRYGAISLKKRERPNVIGYKLPYTLEPGECILASSYEIFHLPLNISAEYKLKSSMARIWLEHLNAGWCDAGWNGSVLTLELKNMTRNHKILLEEEDKVGQIVFFRHTPVPADKSYAVRGRYNGDTTAQGVKK